MGIRTGARNREKKSTFVGRIQEQAWQTAQRYGLRGTAAKRLEQIFLATARDWSGRELPVDRQGSKSDQSGLSFQPDPRDCLSVLSPEETLRLFERSDLTQLAEKVSAAKFLDAPTTPVLGLLNLRDVLADFSGYLSANAEPLVRRGYPEFFFSGSDWLSGERALLYPTKLPLSSALFKEDGVSVFHYTWTNHQAVSIPEPDPLYRAPLQQLLGIYRFIRVPKNQASAGGRRRRAGRRYRNRIERLKAVLDDYVERMTQEEHELLDEQGNPLRECDFSQSALIPGLNQEEATLLAAERVGLVGLKKAVIGQVLPQIDENTPWRMRDKVFELVTDMLPSDRLKALMSMDDRLYSSVTVWGRFSPRRHWRLVGSLTEILQLAGHCEKEIRIGTMRVAHQSLLRIRSENLRGRGDLGLEGLFYLEAKRGRCGPAHSALEQFERLERDESRFWRQFVRDFKKWVRDNEEGSSVGLTRRRRHVLGRFSASLDFRTVWLDGSEYEPTPLQARIIECIFTRQANRIWAVSQDWVMNTLNSTSRVRDAFRSRPDIWNEVFDRPARGKIRIRIDYPEITPLDSN